MIPCDISKDQQVKQKEARTSDPFLRLIFDLDPETALKLRAMAQAQGRTVEELVADVLREYPSQYQRPRIPGMGKYDSGETDISERAEEILTEAAMRGGWH